MVSPMHVIVQHSSSGETERFGVNAEETEQMNRVLREVGTELRFLGDTLESRYLRPLHVARQIRGRLQIAGTMIDLARFIFFHYVREILGFNN